MTKLLSALIGLLFLSAPSLADGLSNCEIAASVAGGSLTLSLLTQGGLTPTPADPCIITFRDTSPSSGDFHQVAVTAATQFTTAASGSTFGAANNTPFRIWVTAWNNAGIVELGASTQSSPAIGIFPLDETVPQSSVACNGCNTASQAGVFYTPTQLSAVPIRVLGYVDFALGQVIAGVWNNSPTKVQSAGIGGMRLPGESVQATWTANQTSDTPNTTMSYIDVIAWSITLTDPVNFVYVSYHCTMSSDLADTRAFTIVRRGGAQIGIPTFVFSGASAPFDTNSGEVWDFPGSSSKQTYAIGIASGTPGNNVHGCTDSGGGSISLEEVAG